MRKKQLILQNTKLFDEVSALELAVAELKNELAQKDNEIEKLQNKLKEYELQNVLEEALTEEENEINEVNLEPDVNYGATVIGKTVVEATKCCNSITVKDTTENAKELINLILGRTEVAKAEILKIVSSKLSDEEKIKNIDNQYDLALDYFKSVMAQI